MVRFKWLSGDVNALDYGGKWISNKQSNTEFDYYFVIELTNMEDTTGDTKDGKYLVSLVVVAPSQVNEVEMQKAKESCGWEGMDDSDIESIVELLQSYGISALVSQELGNNARRLLRQAKQEAKQCEFLFGFYMDRQQNAIGSSGWDFLQGDILAGLKK